MPYAALFLHLTPSQLYLSLMRTLLSTLVLIALSASAAFAQPGTPVPGEPNTFRVSADIDVNTTWSTGQTIILDGYVFVTDNATLTIQPGVIVRGLDDDPLNNILPSGTNLGAISDPQDNVGALIVARDGNIDAQGTAAQPIIFTACSDDLTDPADFTCEDFGFWGGLIILGSAVVSSPEANRLPAAQGGFVENTIEGVITTNPATADLAKFGGTDDDDNSGTLRYVSLRHGGDVLTDGDEVNGLTLGGVGRGTTIEFVEVIANADDGIEWFGGTVDVKNTIVTCVVDDSYDYDQGCRFRAQFAVAVGLGNRLGEHDGGDNPDDATPNATPIFYNSTYIGKDAPVGEQEAIVFRDNAGGQYVNSLFFQSQQGLEIEYRYDRPSSAFQFGNVANFPVAAIGAIQSLDIENNIYGDIQGDVYFLNEVSDGFTGAAAQLRSLSNSVNNLNSLQDIEVSSLLGFNTTVAAANGGQGFDLRAQAAAISAANAAGFSLRGEFADGFFTDVNYPGAVDPAATSPSGQFAGWTASWEYGIIQQ